MEDNGVCKIDQEGILFQFLSNRISGRKDAEYRLSWKVDIHDLYDWL